MFGIRLLRPWFYLFRDTTVPAQPDFVWRVNANSVTFEIIGRPEKVNIFHKSPKILKALEVSIRK